MTATVERLIMQTIINAMEGVTVANGFSTDAGSRVFVYQVRLDNEVPSMGITISEMDPVDQAKHTGAPTWWQREIVIDALDHHDPDDRLKVEDVLNDMQTALAPLRDIAIPTNGIQRIAIVGGGITSRETGTKTIGCFVRIGVQYLVRTVA